ncbi:MAG: hypothetical protein M1339_07505 [Bacteroidetes bacterium]|nr:hypothetical protein [Bacteroidota bacterium]
MALAGLHVRQPDIIGTVQVIAFRYRYLIKWRRITKLERTIMTGINSISSAMSAYQPGGTNAPQNDIRKQFMQLQKALQSGDLSGAQSAYTSIEDSLKGAGSSQSPLSGTNQASTDFQALGQALQSGDMSSAQSVLATFQQDMQAAGQAGASGTGSTHRRRGGHFSGAMAQQMKDFKSLASALQSGDATSAQSALSSFLQDIQNNSSSSNPFTANSSVSTDLQNVQSALQSGSVSTAQSAFSSLMQALVPPGMGANGSSGSSPYSSYQQQSLIGNTVDATA